MSSYGITGYRAYVPRLRRQCESSVPTHRAHRDRDEDSLAMAVEAALGVLCNLERARIGSLTIAATGAGTAAQPCTNIIAGALGLPRTTRTCEIGQSQRAGVSALLARLGAADGNALFIASGLPAGEPASTQERIYGAGAAAFTLGKEGVIAELIGAHSLWNVYADRFRLDDARQERQWDDHSIGDEAYAGIVPAAVAAALDSAGLRASDVRHFIFASPVKGSSALVAQRCGIAREAVDTRMDERSGHASAAHPCLMLAATLERSKPGDVLVVVGFGRGCDVLVLRATGEIDELKPRYGLVADLFTAVPELVEAL